MIGQVRERLFMGLHSSVKTGNNNIQEKIINFTAENNSGESSRFMWRVPGLSGSSLC